MGSIIGTIAAIAFLVAIVYYVLKELKEDGDSSNLIPKEYRSVFIIVGVIFLFIIAVLIYNNFISGHYNN